VAPTTFGISFAELLAVIGLRLYRNPQGPIEAKEREMNKGDETRGYRTRQVGLAALAATLCVMICGTELTAKEQTASGKRKVPAVFESEKSWEFKDKQLVFYSRNPNASAVRFIRWKDYNWVVTAKKIMVIDPRPYGTRLQAPRHRTIKGGKTQTDKDLMNELKKDAKKVREAREPKSRRPSVGLGVGVGFGGRRGFGGVGVSLGF
jgi:hypothetical protein